MIGDILQPTHLLLILVVALLVLGPKRLPEAGRALGRGLRDFRSAISGIDPREDLTAKPELQVAASSPAANPAPTATIATSSTASQVDPPQPAA